MLYYLGAQLQISEGGRHAEYPRHPSRNTTIRCNSNYCLVPKLTMLAPIVSYVTHIVGA
jgi:hypothetical protein